MSRNSTIAWLARPGTRTATWNPVRGCTRKSRGCVNCYAERMAARFSDPGYWGHGYAERVPTVDGTGWVPRWTGKVDLIDDALDAPTKWRAPHTVFVNSTSDLFHEKLNFADIDAIVRTIVACPRHEFLALTKRPDRMREWALGRVGDGGTMPANLWLGVSVEDQATADERIPILLDTPAALRWISAEPLVERVDLNVIRDSRGFASVLEPMEINGGTGQAVGFRPALDWVVVGGESGPGAAPFNPDWARQIVRDCEAACVPVFVKQLGVSNAVTDGKGEDISHWPADLRVRAWPR